MISEVIIAALVLLNCGYVESGTNPLTMEGGTDTNTSNEKFMALIYTDTEHFVGIIISAKLVLTSYLSIVGNEAKDITVHVGGKNETVVHKYSNTAITLLLLEKTLTFNNATGPPDLPIEGDSECPVVGKTIKALGFGEGGSKIQEVNLTIINNTECYSGSRPLLHRYWCCAESSNGKLSKEDQGGPVIYEDKIIGILSMVFTRRPYVIFNVAIHLWKDK